MTKSYTTLSTLFLLLLFCLLVKPGTAQESSASTGKTLYFPVINQAANLKSIGPFGGSVTALAIDPLNRNIIFAGTYGGGVYKSTDYGNSWTHVSSGLSNSYVLSLVIDPRNPDIVYAGTSQSGVFKTMDGGQSWRISSTGLNEIPIVYALAIDRKNPITIYAGTRKGGTLGGGGVYKSTDGGQSWTAKNRGLDERYVYDLAIDPFQSEILYAATHEMGVYKSTNGGNDWAFWSVGVNDRSARALAIDTNRNYITYLGTWHGDSIYKSDDYGRNWYQSSNGISPAKVYSLTIDPVNPDVLYAATYLSGVYVSQDSGSSWAPAGLYNNFVYSVVVNPVGARTLLAGLMDKGIYRSDNQGLSWSSSQTGLSATVITSMSQVSTSSALFVGTYGNGLFSSVDNGATWTARNSGLNDRFIHTLLQLPSNPNVLYAGTQSGGVYKSVDGGSTWFSANGGLPQVSTSMAPQLHEGALPYNSILPEDEFYREFEDQADEITLADIHGVGVVITSLATHPDHSSTIYMGTTNGLFKTDNAGLSWYGIGFGETAFHYIAVDPFQPKTVFAATNGSSGSIYKSLDGGISWTLVNSGISGIGVYSLWMDPKRVNVIYAATEKGVYKSETGGTVWAPSGLSGRVVYTLAGSPTDPSALYAGTSSGIYKSNNSGRSWTEGDYRLSNRVIRSVLPHPSAAQAVFVGTNNFGVYLWSKFQP
jgi:photosystem II stability/assembly factor-like uncharacterized protein